MDKIYTRNRIRFPKIHTGNGKINPRRKFAINSIIILIIAIFTLEMEIRAITPILDKVCSDVAKSKATIIANDKATEVMKDYTYDDFIKIYKDEDGNIKMIQSNIITINEVTSGVAVKIQKELESNHENIGEVKLRKFDRNEDIIRYRTNY